MKSVLQLKAGAARVRALLEKKGISISNGLSLETAAVFENCPNWDTARALSANLNLLAALPAPISSTALVAPIASDPDAELPSFGALISAINKVGHEAEARRLTTRFRVFTRNDIMSTVPSREGIYWIETTMPVEEISKATLDITGKETRPRTSKPVGNGFTNVDANDCQIIYIGTQSNMRARLLQHLFNEGHEKTGKLRCIVDVDPFDQFEWYVSYCSIDAYAARYSIEAWWRLNIGWPPFCVR